MFLALITHLGGVALSARSTTSLIVLPLDVADEKSVSAAGDAIRKRTKHVDLLINNAGAVGFRLVSVALPFFVLMLAHLPCVGCLAGIAAPTHPVDDILTAKKDVMLQLFSTNVVGYS